MPISSYQDKYPKHHVAIDCVIFGYEEDQLKVLMSKRRFTPAEGDLSLIGGFIRGEETAEEAACRVLKLVTGHTDIFQQQVEVFSAIDRDPGGRVISVVFYAMIRIDKHDRDLTEKHGTEWIPFDKIPSLVFDHSQMLKAAHDKLKQKASHELIGKDLLTSKFTLTQLRSLYEAIFQKNFDPGNFRKKVLSFDILEKQKDKNTAGSKKGAFYYRFTANNTKAPQEIMAKGF